MNNKTISKEMEEWAELQITSHINQDIYPSGEMKLMYDYTQDMIYVLASMSMWEEK